MNKLRKLLLAVLALSVILLSGCAGKQPADRAGGSAAAPETVEEAAPEGEDQELAESLIEETGANYAHLLLNESLYNALLTDVSAVPTTFFVDENGTVLDTVVGAMEKAAWEEMINGLLEEL